MTTRTRQRRRNRRRKNRTATRRPQKAGRRVPTRTGETAMLLERADHDLMCWASVLVSLVVANPEHAGRFAEALLTRTGSRAERLSIRLARTMDLLVDGHTTAGWLPSDLIRVVSRRADAEAAAVVASALRYQAHRAGPQGVDPEWQEEIDELPPGLDVDPFTRAGLRNILLVIAALRGLPPLPVIVTPPTPLVRCA
ncbi:hypothetical protein [Sporichthya polymorpha]|uniref:hypothetical protein n=1 Tax=Sporichthya polymorpha TaxID=35751 RepID=UPI0012EC4CDD|nr:hypothetical protein [Sporichthya polymorpha]